MRVPHVGAAARHGRAGAAGRGGPDALHQQPHRPAPRPLPGAAAPQNHLGSHFAAYTRWGGGGGDVRHSIFGPYVLSGGP